MSPNRKRMMIYSLTLLFVMACRTYACSREVDVITGSGLNLSFFRCESFRQSSNDGPTFGYTCSISCPGVEGVYKFDVYDNPDALFFGMTDAQIKGQYCPASSSEGVASSVPPTETATVVPTPTKGQPVATSNAIQPFLSGKYTACDLNKGFINFRQTEPKLDTTGKKVVLTMNGVAVNCSIPASNPDLYSCALPVGVKFPSEIIVNMNGTEINKFSIDGAACVTTAPTKEEGPEASETLEPTVDPNN